MRRARAPNLLLSAAWSHRGAVIAWVSGAGLFMTLFGPAYRGMIEGFAGGAAAFGLAAQATADAMQPLSGPAFRLDTYAGYVSYHNLGALALFLSIYALIQGARAIRGDEERGVLDLYLTAGKSRGVVLLERGSGFAIALLTIGLGLGVATGAGAALAGEPAWTAGFVVCLEAALTALVFYAAGLLVSQFMGTARGAAGTTARLAVVLYLLTNLSAQLGSVAWLRFLSPFTYYQQSRYAMVSGHSADLVATAVLVIAVAPLGALAGWAFAHRDAGASLLHWQAEREAEPWRARLGSIGSRWLWTSSLREHRLALLAWFTGPLVLAGIYLWIFPQVRSVWEQSDVVRALISRTAGAPLLDGYLSFILTTVAVATAAFAVVEAGRWLADRADGRDEIYLGAAPVSRLRLSIERWVALAAGLWTVAAGTLAGLWLGAASAGLSLNTAGIVRTGADLLLLGLAVGGVGALLVAWLRRGLALGVLSGLLGASYFLVVLQPLFNWPEWTAHLSIFDAFGDPYVHAFEFPGVGLLVGLAIVGAATAAVINSRRVTV